MLKNQISGSILRASSISSQGESWKHKPFSGDGQENATPRKDKRKNTRKVEVENVAVKVEMI
jgi:hypothetical protein